MAAFAARCEDAGFDGVGIHDHPSSGRDTYLALALAAQATHRLTLFPAASSPLVRHPLVLASLAHSLDEIAPGRTYLTVGPGFISTRSIGQPRANVAFMRDAVRDLRRLLAGEEVAFGTTATRLRNRSATATPVYLLAAGPRMIELAGEVADGALLFVGLDPAAVRAARRHLAIGAQRAGRSLDGFPVMFVVTFGLGPDNAAGAQWVQSWFAPGQPFLCYPSASNLRWLKQAGFDLPAHHDPAAIGEAEARALPMHSDFSARRSVVRSTCCALAKKRASRRSSCSRRMICLAGTTCPRRKSRRSSASSGRGSVKDTHA